MTVKLSELVKDKSKIDLKDICSDWEWLVNEQKNVLLVTLFGDLFFIGSSDEVNWLDTGTGSLTRIAENVKHFEDLLEDKENFNDWFMVNFYLDLQKNHQKLKDNEVYSYKKLPILGGDYTTDNIEATDISVHFSVTGQICQQIKDLPDGTEVRLASKQKPWWKIW
jgi:hypothetical protein